MDAGELDRRITLQRQGAETDDGYTTLPGAWEDLADVWAKLMPLAGAEKVAALENAGSARRKFKVRKSTAIADLNAKDRIEYPIGSENYHDIVDVAPLGRAFLIIDAVARNDS